MTNREMSFEQAFDFAMDLYLAGKSDYNPDMTTTAADLEKALAPWDITVTSEGWPSLTHGPVTIDGYITVMGHYDPAVRWNGWLCPSFDRDVAEKVAAWANEDPESARFTWEGDVLVYEQPNYPDSEPERIEPDSNGHYSIGAFSWVWSVAKGDD
ncbi:hypothetical protein [Kribbella deserti]|uniref:Uncharacterized protein n=1 Tax=Kribbella deserti TaxID=1926257 RepID=A0ABV6QGN3_9ACTN